MLDQADRELRRAEQSVRAAERWLKVSSVSRRLDVHFRTVYRWIDEGKFTQSEVRQLEGGQWRIAESAVERRLQQIHGSS